MLWPHIVLLNPESLMLQSVSTIPDPQYLNITEVLVKREVDRQLAHLPPRVLRFIKRAEVATYALNRLPALYASSAQGLKFQQQRAQREMGNQLKTAVRQGIAAVQVDPLRASQPITHFKSSEHGASDAVLQTLRHLFDQPEMDWQGALRALKHVTKDQLKGQASEPTTATHRQRWRPGTYGKEVAWQPKPPATQTLDFDWSDARYQR
jgi:hypothetical protein